MGGSRQNVALHRKTYTHPLESVFNPRTLGSAAACNEPHKNTVTTQKTVPYATEEHPYFGISVPLMSYLGLVPEHIEDGYARARLPKAPGLTNSRGDVHGGTLMSVLDFLMSAAARGHDPLNVGIATIEMSTHFLDVARGDLIFEARTLKRGRSTAFCEGKALDSEGTEVCVSRGTFRLIQRNK